MTVLAVQHERDGRRWNRERDAVDSHGPTPLFQVGADPEDIIARSALEADDFGSGFVTLDHPRIEFLGAGTGVPSRRCREQPPILKSLKPQPPLASVGIVAASERIGQLHGPNQSRLQT